MSTITKEQVAETIIAVGIPSWLKGWTRESEREPVIVSEFMMNVDTRAYVASIHTHRVTGDLHVLRQMTEHVVHAATRKLEELTPEAGSLAVFMGEWRSEH